MSTATITADAGPGLTATSQVVNNVREFKFDPDRQVIEFKLENGSFQSFDMDGVTTITCTVTGTSLAFVVS